jgi:HEAT repeat protein
MRLTIPKLRTWHLMGIVAASAALFSIMQFRWSVEDPGYALIRRLRSLDAVERAKAADGLIFLRPRDRRAIAPLTEMLFDPDSRVRASAARALTHIVPQDDEEAGTVKAALTSALVDRDPGARRAIAVSLAHFEPEQWVVIPALLEFTKDANPAARGDVIECLGFYSRRDEAARAAVFAALGDPAFEVRWRAVNALSWCAMVPKLAPKPLVETIIAALMDAADDESASVRAAAVQTLARIAGATKTEIPRVIEALGDPDAQVRLAAACFLGWRGAYKRSPTLVPALGLALADPDAQVREWSARSLGYLGLDAEAALPALRAVGKDPQIGVREQAAQAISAIEKSALTFRATTLPQALADLDDADPITRALAAGRIEDLGSKASDAVPSLVRCLADREADVRLAAAKALGQIGPRASVAIPTLVNLGESDPDERVRRAATLSRSILLRQEAKSGGSSFFYGRKVVSVCDFAMSTFVFGLPAALSMSCVPAYPENCESNSRERVITRRRSMMLAGRSSAKMPSDGG